MDIFFLFSPADVVFFGVKTVTLSLCSSSAFIMKMDIFLYLHVILVILKYFVIIITKFK